MDSRAASGPARRQQQRCIRRRWLHRLGRQVRPGWHRPQGRVRPHAGERQPARHVAVPHGPAQDQRPRRGLREAQVAWLRRRWPGGLRDAVRRHVLARAVERDQWRQHVQQHVRVQRDSRSAAHGRRAGLVGALMAIPIHIADLTFNAGGISPRWTLDITAGWDQPDLDSDPLATLVEGSADGRIMPRHRTIVCDGVMSARTEADHWEAYYRLSSLVPIRDEVVFQVDEPGTPKLAYVK